MLARGMKNKDIHSYPNRHDRVVDLGRITGIRDRSYGPDIHKAGEKQTAMTASTPEVRTAKALGAGMG